MKIIEPEKFPGRVKFQTIGRGQCFSCKDGSGFYIRLLDGYDLYPYGGSVRNAIDLSCGVPTRFEPEDLVTPRPTAELVIR